MPLPKDQAWFPTKTYGYGWGLPSRWQGWAVMIGFIVALALGGIFLAGWNIFLYIGYVVVISAILTAICMAKGEAPRWRWGNDDSAQG